MFDSVIPFYRACREAGIAPIIGCEVVVEAAGIIGDEEVLPPEARLSLLYRQEFDRRACAAQEWCPKRTDGSIARWRWPPEEESWAICEADAAGA